jgi:hypothetical protein
MTVVSTADHHKARNHGAMTAMQRSVTGDEHSGTARTLVQAALMTRLALTPPKPNALQSACSVD